MLAYSIVLGHSIIPHHHHDDDHALEQAPTENHEDHHDDDESSGLEHDLGNYLHASGAENSYKQQALEIPVHQIASAYLICNFTFQINPDESPPLLVRRSNDHIPILRHSLFPKGLRAPPLA